MPAPARASGARSAFYKSRPYGLGPDPRAGAGVTSADVDCPCMTCPESLLHYIIAYDAAAHSGGLR